MVDNVTISVTEDYPSLVPFFIENELEFTEDDDVPEDEIIKCWKAVDDEGNLVGGCILALRDGEFICDGIASDPKYRSIGLGKKLLKKLTDEVKQRGGDRIYLVARAPGFFKKNGFEIIPREEAPEFFECFTCPQYKKSCFPEVMRLSIQV